jgi:hypothetical protein
MCGNKIPDNQNSNTCSMCYGDTGHGKDDYYNDWIERERNRENEREYQYDWGEK